MIGRTEPIRSRLRELGRAVVRPQLEFRRLGLIFGWLRTRVDPDHAFARLVGEFVVRPERNAYRRA